MIDEEKLITLAKQGDTTAFNRLVLHYQDAVYNVAYYIMKEPGTAGDMTQEAFISAYKSLRRFRGGSFKAWLMRIATNACYDELRRRKRRPQTSFDELTEDNESFNYFVRDDAPGPEGYQERSELFEAVGHCLDDLPDDQRVTAVLRDVEGYSYEEIADITSVSLGTVKSRISRARTRLRDCLREFGELLPVDYRLTSEGM